jgi:hypothetical protein
LNPFLQTLWTELTIITKISFRVRIVCLFTILSSSLPLWDDHLNWWDIIGVRDRVLHDADASDNFPDAFHLSLKTCFDNVGWVANEHFAIDLIKTHQFFDLLTLNAGDLRIVKQYLSPFRFRRVFHRYQLEAWRYHH